MEVGKSRSLKVEKHDVDEAEVIGKDTAHIYTIRTRTHANQAKAFLGTWDRASLSFVKEVHLSMPVKGASRFTIEAHMVDDRGVGILFSYYDKKSNKRVLAYSTVQPMTGDCSEPQVIHASGLGSNVESGLYHVVRHVRSGRISVAHFTMEYAASIMNGALVAMTYFEGPFEILLFDDRFNLLHSGKGQLTDTDRNMIESIHLTDRGDGFFLTYRIKDQNDAWEGRNLRKVAVYDHTSGLSQWSDLKLLEIDERKKYDDHQFGHMRALFTESPSGQVFLLRYRDRASKTAYAGVEWHSFDQATCAYTGMRFYTPPSPDIHSAYAKMVANEGEPELWFDMRYMSSYWDPDGTYVDLFMRERWRRGIWSGKYFGNEHAVAVKMHPSRGYSDAIWCGADRVRKNKNNSFPEGFVVLPDTADHRALIIGVGNRQDARSSCGANDIRAVGKYPRNEKWSKEAGIWGTWLTSDGFSDRSPVYEKGDCWSELVKAGQKYTMSSKPLFQLELGISVAFVDISVVERDRNRMRLARITY